MAAATRVPEVALQVLVPQQQPWQLLRLRKAVGLGAAC